MNNLFSGASNAYESSAASFGVNGSIVMWVLVALFTIVVVYMVIGKSIPTFGITDIIPKSTSVYFQSKKVWPPSGNVSQLVAYPSQFGTLEDAQYTFNMDLVIKESRTNQQDGIHRHIFHRGSDEYAGTAVTALPKRMNPGVFMDPLTNDLLIFVDTLGGATGYRESLRIPDIPLSIPFRLGIVMNNRTMDIYINCRLEETKWLQGTPKTVEQVLYGVAGPSPAPVQLQNVYSWAKPLGANEVSSVCGSLPVFTLTPTCGIPLPIAPSIESVVTTNVSEYAAQYRQQLKTNIKGIFNVNS